jgi:hypothetical protein
MKKISRKEAIKKVGITALATSSLLLLNTQAKAQASGGKGNNGWGNGDQNAPGNSLNNNNAENGPKSNNPG